MTVYQGGYECPNCGPVDAKLSWSDKENDVVAYCRKCGMKLQRVIPKPYTEAAFKLPFSTPIVAQNKGQRGGPGQMNRRHESNPAAPATPTQEDTA